MKETVSQLRKERIRLIFYLDDILILGESRQQACWQVQMVAYHLSNLGFVLNEKKCVFQPQTCIKFLGFIVNSQTMTVSLPQSKVSHIVEKTNSLMRVRKVSARKLAHIIGKMTASLPAVMYQHYCTTYTELCRD